VKRALHLLEQVGDAVQGKTRAQAAQIARHHSKRLPSRRRGTTHQPAAKRVVDDLAKSVARPASLRFQLRRHVLVQRESGAHALMLANKHHDVKAWLDRTEWHVIVEGPRA